MLSSLTRIAYGLDGNSLDSWLPQEILTFVELFKFANMKRISCKNNSLRDMLAPRE